MGVTGDPSIDLIRLQRRSAIGVGAVLDRAFGAMLSPTVISRFPERATVLGPAAVAIPTHRRAATASDAIKHTLRMGTENRRFGNG
jgi:hypothetical protein